MSSIRVGVALLALAPSLTPGAAEEPSGAPSCRIETIATSTVAAVMDSRTVRLGDGREVRLAGLEVPPAAPGASPAEASKTALAALVEGKPVLLRRSGRASGRDGERATDRHGRLVGHLFVIREETEHSVQQALLATGHARMAARTEDTFCGGESSGKWTEKFIAAERSARTAKLGLWRIPGYEVKRAEDPAGLLGERGRFVLVEGKVVSVRESGGTIYVNFGRRWSEDFTVTIAKRNERIFTAAGIEPGKLTGRQVTVRGYVEARGGPWIEAVAPEQIEVGR